MSAEADNQFIGNGLRCVRGARRVFDSLDFCLTPGDALVLRGPNGSGKSSLLRLMAGLARPAAGTLVWHGQPVDRDRERHGGRLHYVGHAEAVKAAITVRESLAFWTQLRGGSLADIEPALERIGLAHRADFPGRYLSAGQKKRLALARLIVAPAPLWLLDEATVGLDQQGVDLLEGMIDDHRAGGGMVVLATHVPVRMTVPPATLELSDFAPTVALADPFGEPG